PLSGFRRRPGRQCGRPRPPAYRQDHPRPGRKALPRLQPLLPRISGRLAEKLCGLSGLQRVFFSNSGTEAIEGSIKLARLAGHRVGGETKCQLVALEGSYHGRTFGALSLTGQDKYRKGFEPLLEDVKFV